MKKPSKKYLFLWSFLLVVVLCIISIPTKLPGHGLVLNTRLQLYYIREQIDAFQELNGKYPNSLSELRTYVEQNQDAGFITINFKEYLSSKEGDDKEYNILNGKGGWYYNKSTGELKINLTKTVKHYVRFYIGRYRNDIPADWFFRKVQFVELGEVKSKDN